MEIKKDFLFISHAIEDNDFTQWLSLQLVGLGYNVWTDLIKLTGADDFWPVIEDQIRNHSFKFLIVLSKTSNTKTGVLNELAVANKVKRTTNDPKFVIPLAIDKNLQSEDVNIELNRIDSINFKKSWAEGLKDLIELLEEVNCPKNNPNYEEVNLLWQTVFLQNKKPLLKPESYASNWFPITELPKVLRFHNYKNAIQEDYNLRFLPFPSVRYKKYIATFAWCYDFLKELPKTESYNPQESYEINVREIIEGNFSSDFISNKVAKNLIIQLLNKGFEESVKKKPVAMYVMSNKISFWIQKGVLEKDKFNKTQLIGKQKDKQWHFGISGNVKLFPEKCFVINSHIWFTSNGTDLIPEASTQHTARRRQGKNWWNNDWRSKTISFVEFLSEEDGTIHVQLGSEEFAKFSNIPITFSSPVSYNDPNKDNLPEEDFHEESENDDL